MSRLDSFIRRLAAQRDCLDRAADMIRDIPGPVLEIGLGNGRTYDHLRELLPDREIFVFDRRVAAHPDCVPDSAHMIVGDIRQTLASALERIAGPVALAHCDLGIGDDTVNQELAAFVGAALNGQMQPGGLVVADQKMTVPGWISLPLPPGVRPARYFMYRAGEA